MASLGHNELMQQTFLFVTDTIMKSFPYGTCHTLKLKKKGYVDFLMVDEYE